MPSAWPSLCRDNSSTITRSTTQKHTCCGTQNHHHRQLGMHHTKAHMLWNAGVPQSPIEESQQPGMQPHCAIGHKTFPVAQGRWVRQRLQLGRGPLMAMGTALGAWPFLCGGSNGTTLPHTAPKHTSCGTQHLAIANRGIAAACGVSVCCNQAHNTPVAPGHCVRQRPQSRKGNGRC